MSRLPGGARVWIVVVAMAAAGCGSSATASGGAGDGVDAAFHDKAVAACQKILDAKRAWEPFPAGSFNPNEPDPAKLVQVGTWLDTTVLPTWERWKTDVAALGTPASGAAAWTTVADRLSDNVDIERVQIAAGQAADPVAFAAATVKLQANHIALIAATRAAGVDACGDIVR